MVWDCLIRQVVPSEESFMQNLNIIDVQPSNPNIGRNANSSRVDVPFQEPYEQVGKIANPPMDFGWAWIARILLTL